MAHSDDFTQCFGCGRSFVKGFDPDRTRCPECWRRAQLGDFSSTADGDAAVSRVVEERSALVKALEDAKTPGELYVAYHAASPSAGTDAFGLPLKDVYQQEREAMMRELGMDSREFATVSRREGLLLQIGASAVCLEELVVLVQKQKSSLGRGSLIERVSELSRPFGREVSLVARQRKSRMSWLYQHNAARVTLRADERDSIRVQAPGQPVHEYPIDARDPGTEAKRLLAHSIELLAGQRPGIR